MERPEHTEFIEDDCRFFIEPLGRDARIPSPGGSRQFAPTGADTPMPAEG